MARFRPDGEIIGVELSALLEMAGVLGYDRDALIWLFPYLNSGIVQACESHEHASEPEALIDKDTLGV